MCLSREMNKLQLFGARQYCAYHTGSSLSWLKRIQTVTGPVNVDSLGLILPHEHLFTDLRGPLVDGHAQAEPEVVVHVVQPYLVDASAAGLVALVEYSTVGVGRNLAILRKPK